MDITERLAEAHDALRNVRTIIPKIHERLALAGDVSGWLQAIDTRLLPQTDPAFPLLVAVCGGGSSGKSTLFNALVGEHVSAVGGTSGLSRRVLVAVSPAFAAREDFLRSLFAPFGAAPRRLESPAQMTDRGPPLYVASASIGPGTVLLDTPDFDTGHDEAYVNREVVRPVLEAADVLMYIFTNATYGNRENLRFMARMLTECGRKKCVLVYRVYESFSGEDVLAHARSVAENLYGPEYASFVLGIYRVADSPEVAAGTRPIEIRAAGEGPPLAELVRGLNPVFLRREALSSAFGELRGWLDATADEAESSVRHLELYGGIARLVQSHTVMRAIARLPAHAIAVRIDRHWRSGSPSLVRGLRAVGRATVWPLKAIGSGAAWLKRALLRGGAGGGGAAAGPREEILHDIVESANDLRRAILDATISARAAGGAAAGSLLDLVDEIRERDAGCSLPRKEHAGAGWNLYAAAHPALDAPRRALRDTPSDGILERIAQAAGELDLVPDELDRPLAALVRELRAQMGVWGRSREWLFPSLDVVPATAAVSFETTDGKDAGGAVTASMRALYGLDGLRARVGVTLAWVEDERERQALARTLGSAFEHWLGLWSVAIERILESHITGAVHAATERALDGSRDAILKLRAFVVQFAARE